MVFITFFKIYKNYRKTFISITLVTVMLVSGLLYSRNETVYADGNDLYNSLICSYLDDNNQLNYFYMMTPKKDGKYPLLIMMAGMGGPDSWDELVSDMNRWVGSGNVDPMVVVMPLFPDSSSYSRDSDEYIQQIRTMKYSNGEFYTAFVDSQFKTMLKRMGNQEINCWEISDAQKTPVNEAGKIDLDSGISVSGYSMGGAGALYAGVKHSDVCLNVGGLSPANYFYISDDNWDMIKKAENIVFSGVDGTHLFMGYGFDEYGGQSVNVFKDSVKRYDTVTRTNGKNTKEFAIYETPGSHRTLTFYRELFVFLTYIQKDKLLNDADDHELLAEQCGEYDHEEWKLTNVIKPATCLVEGQGEYVCSSCKKTKTDIIPITDHALEGVEDVTVIEPTCETEGKTKGVKCPVCGAVISEPKVIPAKGHSWDEGRIVKEATAKEAGQKLYTCTVCGKTKTEEIPIVKEQPDDKKGSSETTENPGTAESISEDSVKDIVEASSIRKLKKGRKSFTVKWKKISGISGYQIQYSTEKSFKNKKTVTIKGQKKKSKTIKNLKAKKKYYVRIRTYKLVEGKKKYSQWSGSKTVTTK